MKRIYQQPSIARHYTGNLLQNPMASVERYNSGAIIGTVPAGNNDDNDDHQKGGIEAKRFNAWDDDLCEGGLWE